MAKVLILGIIIILFWAGSWAIPQVVSLIPISKSTWTPVPYTKTPIPSFTPTFTALQPTKTPTRNSTPTRISTPTITPTPSIFGIWLLQFDDRCDGNFWGTRTLKINTDKTLEMLWQVSWQEELYNYKTILKLNEQWVRWSLGYTEFDGKWEGYKMSGSYIRGIGGTAGCWKAEKR